jgi:hypothetical protein
MDDCYGCNNGYVILLHTCGTTARQRYNEYLGAQEGEETND